MVNKRKQKQHPKTSRKYKTTLEKGGKNPPNVTIDDITQYLSEYLPTCFNIEKAEREIKKKYAIDKEPGVCWSDDDIKRVWGKTQRLNKFSVKKKKRLSLALALQLMNRRSGCNTSETNADPDQIKIENLVQDLQLTDDSPTFYIQIPFLKMFGSESDSREPTPKDVMSTYKLIDGVPSNKDIRVKKYYVMSYNSETKNAEWVYEILNRATLAENNVTDLSFSKCMQNPDYDQGHLAAAANHRWCQEAYNSTFLFSNISPQVRTLNNGIWKKLEEYCRKIIDDDKENKVRNVHVYTGPIAPENGSDSEDEKKKKIKGEKRKGKKRVRKVCKEKLKKEEKVKSKKANNADDLKKKKAVPAAFFKVIIVENNNGIVECPKCYLMPNDELELKDDKIVMTEANVRLEWYEKQVEDIERISGLKFMKSSCKKGHTDRIRMVTWTGEKGNGEPCSAKIEVRITTPLSNV